MSIYSDVINVDDLWEKRDTFNYDRWELSYWCKDCESIVEATLISSSSNIKGKDKEILQTNKKNKIKIKNKNNTEKKYECDICKWNDIVLWTEEWLKWFYLRKKF